jgi:hypothetical protein
MGRKEGSRPKRWFRLLRNNEQRDLEEVCQGAVDPGLLLVVHKLHRRLRLKDLRKANSEDMKLHTNAK